MSLIFFSIAARANCTGTSEDFPRFFADAAERAATEAAALANCCAGAKIYWEQTSPPLSGSWTIMVDGGNSSCNVE